MLHNSIYVRELLRARNNDPSIRKRRNPHDSVRVDKGRLPGTGEVALVEAWDIHGDVYVPGIREAIQDLQDFLPRLGVQLNLHASRKIVLKINSKIEHGAFQLNAEEEQIIIEAKNMQGMWAGLVYFEKEMAIRHAAILPKGPTFRRPTWDAQISQAPYGANFLVPDLSPEYISDDAFCLLAHYGINGMLIYGDWLCYVRSNRFPELNRPDYENNILMLRDTAQRAKKYGIQLYFVPVGPKIAADHRLFQHRPDVRGAALHPGPAKLEKKLNCLCSSHPESLLFHGEVMANLVSQVPDLGGLVLIVGGEAFKHCFMRADTRALAPGMKTNCPRCVDQQPEKVVSTFVKSVADAVHMINNEVKVLVWEYSAHMWSSDPDQLELIRQLPEDVSLLTTLDKGQWVQKNGYKKHIWDYSVEYAGPADRVLLQTKVAKQRDLNYFIKAETAIGLECVQYPYIPALRQIGEKWKSVAALKPKGVIQSWFFFGMWGSRAEEMGWWASWHPELNREEVVAMMAKRDFAEFAPLLIEVWDKISEAASHIPYIGAYYTGPEFLGPAHPLFFTDPEEIPEIYTGSKYLPEFEETFSTTIFERKHSLVTTILPTLTGWMEVDDGRDPWDVVLDEYELAVVLSGDAYDKLNKVGSVVDSVVGKMMAEEKNLVEMIHRTFRSTLHTIRFLRNKKIYEQTHDPQYMAEMIDIAEQELQNAQNSRHIFSDAPWLDIQQRTECGDFHSSIDMVDYKIASLQRELKANKALR